MPCFHPLRAFRSSEVHEKSGKHKIIFNPDSRKALIEGQPALMLPCGQCIGCRSDKAQAMGQRCGHEQKMHDASCFFTLTYDDEHVPADYSVKLRDWQLFLKRTRKRTKVKGLRFAGGGEYGELGLRPHYHGLFFNYDFPDKKLLQKRNGHPVYSSELLSELWENKGSTELGSVTHASAAYVARYSMKKITGEMADDHYWRVSPVDGESHRVASEFFTSSRRPGLGSSWFDKFKDDAFSFGRTESGRVSGVVDFVIVDGQRRKPAPYYLGKLKERDQKAVKRARKRASMEPQARANATPERLKVREFIKRDRMKRLIRPLE